MRLPIRYFDSTKTGVLISRIMTDAEGIRNLVGTGIVQLTGSIVSAVLALGVLLYLNWKLTAVTILILGTFGGGMAMGVQAAAAAVPRARQDQRGGDRPARRIARRRPHRQSLHGREARRSGLRQRGAPAVPQRGADDDRRVRRRRLVVAGARIQPDRDDADRRVVDSRGRDDDRRLRHVSLVHRADGAAGGPARQHRHADQRSVRRPRSHPRDSPHDDRGPGGCRPGSRFQTCAARWNSPT